MFGIKSIKMANRVTRHNGPHAAGQGHGAAGLPGTGNVNQSDKPGQCCDSGACTTSNTATPQGIGNLASPVTAINQAMLQESSRSV